MKIQKSKRIEERLQKLAGMHMAASNLNAYVTHEINANYVFVQDIEATKETAKQFKEYMLRIGEFPFSVEHTAMLLLIQELLSKALVGFPDQIFSFLMWEIARESKLHDADEINKNPYVTDIVFKDKVQGDFEFRYEEYKPYELEMYNVPKRINEMGIDIPRIGCFEKGIKYPAIFQKSIKSVWMSVSPNEIYTVQKHIDMAKGNVLTLGCGMGYFAYMASLKEDVSSITIIEIEDSVIKLFEDEILPQFKNKDKIKIIKADAVEYMKNLQDGEFDYCFADIWIGVNDVAPYMAIKEIGRKLKKTKISYWIEEGFAALLEAYVYVEILNAFHGMKGTTYSSVSTNDEERIQDYIHRLLENEEISKPEHIDYYLNADNLIKMIDETDIVF